MSIALSGDGGVDVAEEGEFEEGEVVDLLDFESGGEESRGFGQGAHGRSPQVEVLFLLGKA
jgi:hypothetical protein